MTIFLNGPKKNVPANNLHDTNDAMILNKRLLNVSHRIDDLMLDIIITNVFDWNLHTSMMPDSFGNRCVRCNYPIDGITI